MRQALPPPSSGRTVRTASEPAEIVRTFLIENFLLGQGTIEDDASLLESGIVDSTGIVEVASFLETRFDIELEDDDLTAANLDSIQRIAAFVGRKQATGRTTGSAAG
jgi:acyl carrier protein